MQENPSRRAPSMDRAVDGPGRRVGGVGTVHHVLVVGIEQHEVAGADRGEMPPSRVHQEALAVRRHRGAEMVADRFMPVELDGEPEGRRQVDPQLPHFVVGQIPMG